MSICIKDLVDYNLLKKCCRIKKFLLKSNFNKNKTKRKVMDRVVRNINIITEIDY